MQRINTATKFADLFGPGKHGFKDGNLGLGILPTDFDALFFNDLQEELLTVIEGAGIAPTAGVRNQLQQAINAMIAGATGNDYKASVRVATVGANITLAGGAPNALDGVNLAANDRIMVKDQTTPSQNGLYYVVTLGTGANGTWARVADADGAGELTSGAVVAVEEGTINVDSQWMLTTDGALTIGTTPLSFARKDAGSIGGFVQGAFKNLKIAATGVANTNAVLTADELVLENASNQYVTCRAVNLTINSTANGANGLDTGALAASTWYSVWVIQNAAGNVAGLLSLSATAPTMPSGYTYKARFGWVRTDGSGNKYLFQTLQLGRRAHWVPLAGSNLTTAIAIASGAATGWTAASVSTGAPPTASVVSARLYASSNVAIAQGALAPSAAFAAASDGNIYLFDNTNAGTLTLGVTAELLLQSSNIYWQGASVQLSIFGWEDNI